MTIKKKLKRLAAAQRRVRNERLNEPYESLAMLHNAKTSPEEGDWLLEMEEKGRTFKEYTKSNPHRPTKFSRIYICEVGEFDGIKRKLLKDTIRYIEAFFGLEVKVHSKVDFDSIPSRGWRSREDGNIQIHTDWVLSRLKRDVPDDAQTYIAFSSYDLYPEEDWNFVFGMASLRDRTGVWSIYRNGDPKEDYTLCLRRTISTAIHEICHAYGIVHCIGYECLMNGSMSLEESDRGVLYMCPQCLNKLVWNSNMNIEKRMNKMMEICEELGLNDGITYYDGASFVVKKAIPEPTSKKKKKKKKKSYYGLCLEEHQPSGTCNF